MQCLTRMRPITSNTPIAASSKIFYGVYIQWVKIINRSASYKMMSLFLLFKEIEKLCK